MPPEERRGGPRAVGTPTPPARLLFRVHGSRTLAVGRESRIEVIVIDRARTGTGWKGPSTDLVECDLRLRITCLQAAADSQKLRWQEGVARVRLRVGPFAGEAGRVLPVSSTLSVQGVAVARANFVLRLAETEAEADWLPIREERFRSALALCAARERERFVKRLVGLRDSFPEFRVAMPFVLRVLDDAELVRTLERFDVLLLSWLRQTRASDLVRRICRLAVAVRGPGVIEAVASGRHVPADRDLQKWLSSLDEARRPSSSVVES